MSVIRKKIKKLIPANLQFRLVNLKHTFTKFKQIHYSQNGEDIILNAIFPNDYKGFYVDVGAHHPYRISNTYLLFTRGWHGVNIDANPETINMFKRARPHDTNLNIGVSGNSDYLNYHSFSDPAVNTFSAIEAEKWKNKKWIKYLGAKEVRTDTLANILSKNLPENQIIDVLSIDVEGLDFDVLKSNDWKLYQPRVIIVESHDFKILKKEDNGI